MKKFVAVLAVVIGLAFVTSSFAQAPAEKPSKPSDVGEVKEKAKEKRGEVKEKVREKRQEKKEKVREKRGELREKAKEKKQEMKEKKSEQTTTTAPQK